MSWLWINNEDNDANILWEMMIYESNQFDDAVDDEDNNDDD